MIAGAAGGWPGIGGAAAYAAQKAAEASAPPTNCADCKAARLTIAGLERTIKAQTDEFEQLKANLADAERRLELMMPRSPDVDARSDNETIKRLQEIDRLQHRNIEAAERRVCELTAYIRGRNLPVPEEGGVAVPKETQSWNGLT